MQCKLEHMEEDVIRDRYVYQKCTQNEKMGCPYNEEKHTYPQITALDNAKLNGMSLQSSLALELSINAT